MKPRPSVTSGLLEAELTGPQSLSAKAEARWRVGRVHAVKNASARLADHNPGSAQLDPAETRPRQNIPRHQHSQRSAT